MVINIDRTAPSFLQFHTLHNYSAVALNADDSSAPKRQTYGGSTRTRVSSQALKRHWRTVKDPAALDRLSDDYGSIRSREIITTAVMPDVRRMAKASDEVLDAVEEALQVGLYGPRGADQKSRQSLLLGWPEVRFLQRRALDVCAEHPEDHEAAAATVAEVFDNRSERANWHAFRESNALAGGLVTAMFGRLVTSDRAADVDGAIHVAHSLTVHAEQADPDYFVSVDDLQGDDESGEGSSYIGESELTSGTFYGYAVVDIAQLVSNTTGVPPVSWLQTNREDRETAARLTEQLVRLITTTSPGAKRGATAPYSYASLLLAEVTARQPRSLATAFEAPVEKTVEDAVAAMSRYLSRFDRRYGREEARRLLSITDVDDFPAQESESLDDLLDWVGEVVRSGAMP